ncbi:MAG: DNA polymerase IV [Eubacteriales bacterium]|nr:DNA polymerase IV [Eubacteriales bacterium]
MGDRVILHCDCNAFFASVECVFRPELRSVPMAVAGSPEDRHGIILAKNELAKAFGIQTAETIWQAKRKCPQLVLVPPTRGAYGDFSRRINEIYLRYTDQVEAFSIDESWLDVTGSQHLFGDGPQIADALRATVRKELGITISVGVSFNKIFAKLGSDYKKPDATTVITRENFKDILFPLPVGDMIYVGETACQALGQMGIHTIGDLARTDPAALRFRLGKMGDTLHDYANGLEDSPVRTPQDTPEVKSVGNGMTFRRNLLGEDDVRRGLLSLSDTVAGRLRRHGMKCRTVQVQIKNPSLKVISRQASLDTPTDLAREIFETALELVKANWDLRSPIRMLTVTGSRLVAAEEAGEQLMLFPAQRPWQREKQERVETAMDAIRRKFGEDSLTFGRNLSDLEAQETDSQKEK